MRLYEGVREREKECVCERERNDHTEDADECYLGLNATLWIFFIIFILAFGLRDESSLTKLWAVSTSFPLIWFRFGPNNSTDSVIENTEIVI